MGTSDVILRQYHGQRAVFAAFRGTTLEAEAQISPEAVPDLEARREEAEAAGYAAGYEVGRQAGERALRDQAVRLAELLDGATHEVQAAVRNLEPLVVELALTVAGRVVEQQIADCPEGIREVVRSALSAAGSVRVIRVRVHPNDQPFLEAVWPTLGSGEQSFTLIADESVQPGGCIVDTAAGFVDAQPEVRIEEIRRQIRASLGEAP